MIYPKPIIFDAQSNMSAAFTDRLSSFLHFHADFNEKSYGLMYDEIELLNDFCFIDRDQRLITRKDCKKMVLRPASLEFIFDTFSLFMTLLFTGKKQPSLCLRLANTQNIEDNTKNNIEIPQLVLLVGENTSCNWHYDSKKSKALNNNIELRKTNFDETNILHTAFPPYGYRSIILTGGKTAYSLYITFFGKKPNVYATQTPFTRKKNIPNNLFFKHGKKIQTFFTQFSFDLKENNKTNTKNNPRIEGIGNKDFSNALLWSLFNGWMMVTGKKDRGIWAGLPWFRDNWGRDTFISLPGILLVTGCFKEAKSVIESFAKYQDTNPASPSYGRIPNRYRNKKDVIYNTVDGTLWFIREVWDYAEYTGDKEFLKKIFPVVALALESDRIHRCDAYGFLTHAHADTWMDARIENSEPLSPRANRACDVQALWYTALKIGASMAGLLHKSQLEKTWEDEAERVKTHFLEYFVDKKSFKIADCLFENGLRDESIRPNQLFCVTTPTIVSFFGKAPLVDIKTAEQIAKEVFSHLTFPYGVLSLSQEHEDFHPYHDSSPFYHKDSAYHNGTIWLWNTGPLVETMNLLCAQDRVYEITLSHVKQMISTCSQDWTSRCAGTLSENMDAYPDRKGSLHPSGTFSQTWSLSEFSRNAFASYAGINPSLLQNQIHIKPAFPKDWENGAISFIAGDSQYFMNWQTKENDEIELNIERKVLDKKQKSQTIEIIVLFAQEKESKSYKEHSAFLADGNKLQVSGFIPRTETYYPFTEYLYDMDTGKTPKALKVPNYLYNKLKGITRD